MKLTDEITRYLVSWCNSGSDMILPNFYHGRFECDVLRITNSDIAYEYEIKISRSDYLNDFKKPGKHGKVFCGERVNRFFFVVPVGLVSVEEVPKYAGLIYYDKDKSGNKMYIVKPAPLLSKEKYDVKSLARKCYFRERNIRGKLWDHSRSIENLKAQQKLFDAREDEVRALRIKIGILEGDRWALRQSYSDQAYKKFFPDEQ